MLEREPDQSQHLKNVAQASHVGGPVPSQQLKKVNEELWDVEDKLRLLEQESNFSITFVNFARSVYRLNDERAQIKRKINELSGSELVEEKSYKG